MLSAEQIAKIAESEGVDATELGDAIRAEEAKQTAPGKSDPASTDAAGAESGAKAHGGRGYFAYEYPFLTVNEIRASLYLGTAPDGDAFSGEWLKKHGGGTSAPPTPAP